MFLKELFENKKMTKKQKIKVFFRKILFYKIYNLYFFSLKNSKFKDLIFYKTQKELEKKIKEKFLENRQKNESKFWRSYGW